jgi:hypothetical protein
LHMIRPITRYICNSNSNKKMKYILLLFTLLLLHFEGASRQIYVSNHRGCFYLGTFKNPYKSINQAIRSALPGDTIYLREGEYSENIRIQKYGNQIRNIKIYNYSGEKVSIIPPKKITGWKKISRTIYCIKVHGKVTQLFDNKTPLFQAAYPNLKEGEMNTYQWKPIYAFPNKEVIVQGIESFKNLKNAYFVGIAGRGLTAISGKITHQTKNTIHLKNDGFYWKKEHSNAYLGKGKGYLLGNRAFLDAPGEWFQEGDKLYFQPSNRKQLERIRIRTESNNFIINQCKNIEVKGIYFFGYTVELINSTHCSFINCNFLYPTPFFTFEQSFDRFAGIVNQVNYSDAKNWAGKGVLISGNNNTLNHCTIAHSWGDGVTLLGSKNRLIHSRIEDANWMGTDAAPLNISGNNHLVKNCYLSKSGRSVIVHRKLEKSRICYNEISEAGKLCDDLGILYTYDTDGKGTEIDHNWIHHNDAPYFGSGVYLDNNHAHFSVHHNVIHHCFVGITINQKGTNDSIYNNTLIHNRYTMGSCSPDGLKVNLSKICCYNNITDSELTARDHRSFYGTLLKHNYFIPNLSQFLNNPSNNHYTWRKSNKHINQQQQYGAYPIHKLAWVVAKNVPEELQREQNYFEKIQSIKIIPFILYCFYILLILVSIKKSTNYLVPSRIQYYLFTSKLIGGILIYWMYTSVYSNRESADLFKHFDDSMTIYRLLNNQSFGTFVKFAIGIDSSSPNVLHVLKETNYWNANDASLLLNVDRLLIHLHSILIIFSFGFFPIHLLFFSLLSFRTNLIIFKYLRTIFKSVDYKGLILISLFPSTLIFCSGSLKDTIIFLSFTNLFIHLTTLSFKSFGRQFISIGLSIYLLYILKIYLLIAFVPSILLLILPKKLIKKNKYILFIAIHLLFFGLLLSSTNFKENLIAKKNDLSYVTNEMYPSSGLVSMKLTAESITFLKAIPKSLQNVFLFPSELSLNNLTYLGYFIENLAFIVLFILSVFYPKRISAKSIQIKLCILSILLITGIIVGWTVPIWGSIARYKSPLLALFFGIFYSSIHWEKLKRNILKVNKN